MSLGLVNGHVEFRFDVGSGPVAITSDEISFFTWHTLRFRKHRNAGEFFTACSCVVLMPTATVIYGLGLERTRTLSMT